MKNTAMRFWFVLGLLMTTLFSYADTVSKSEAWSKAQPYMKTQSSMAKAMRGISGVTAEQESQPLYIFSRGEGEGFVIVSGDDCLPAIIGYTESGDYDEENMPPALKAIINHYAEAIADAQARGVNRPYASVTASSYDKDIPVLLTSHWHQNSPWNNLCPQRKDGGGRALTGCVATAASQIAYYWRNEGLNGLSQYDTPTYDYGDAPVTSVIVKKGTPFEWELMADNSTTSAGNAAMARLCVLMGTCAWLTYGASTGGYIWNMQDVFQNQIGLTRGEYVEKYNFSQATWETMVISDLVQGRPILYSSYNKDKEGWDGHAYVVDGYSTKDNTFHINFGWGNGWDGYFTMAETTRTAMGGRPDEQQMVYKVYSQNIDRQFGIAPHNDIYRYIKNPVHVEVKNNSSLPIKGLYFFYSEEETLSSIKKEDAFASLDVTIGKDEFYEGDVDLVTSLMSSKGIYLYITDESLSVLYRSPASYPVKTSKAAVVLDSVIINNSGSTEKTFLCNGEQITRPIYSVASGSVVNVFTTISNNLSGATPCMPAIEILLSSVADNGDNTLITKKATCDSLFQKDDTKTLPMEIGGLNEGQLYKLTLSSRVRNYTSSLAYKLTFNGEAADSVIFFILTGKDFNVERTGSYVTITGSSYEPELVELLTDASVTSFDLRGYAYSIPEDVKVANPNAILYVNANQEVLRNNVVVDGICNNLSLQYGYDYDPAEGFTALKAQCRIMCTPCPGTSYYWNTLSLPFSVKTPDGVLVRKFIDESHTDISNDSIQAGVPYVFLSLKENDCLSAENVDVIAVKDIPEIAANTTLYPTFRNMIADGKLCTTDGKKLTEQELGTVIPAFTCYSTAYIRMMTSLTEVSGLETALHKLIRTYANSRTSLEEYRAERTAQQISVFEAAIAAVEKSLTHLPGVTDEVNNINNELSAAQTAYVDNILPTLRGDANGDGELNMVDAMCVAKAILGNPDASFDEKAADANLDGVIGMSDVMYIVNYVLNGKFPEEQGQ